MSSWCPERDPFARKDCGETMPLGRWEIQMATGVHAPRRRTTRVVAVFVAILLLIMVVAVARRISIDVPHVLAGTLPADTYDVRFVEHHWLAYLHIGPGILYLLGAPLQLTYRFRSRHYTFHRRLGRVLA